MALLEEQFTEKLDAGAPDITYEGNEGQEQQIAQALWDKLPPQVRTQFGDFSQFFNTGAWKKVLQMIQQRQGPEEIQETETVESGPQAGLGSMMQGPRPMAGGGIMGSNAGSMLVAPTADGSRPEYGFLSKVKDFGKKLVGGVKKVVKSPIGKAALLAGGAGLLGGYGTGAKGFGRFGLGNIMTGAKNLWGGLPIGDDLTRPGRGLSGLISKFPGGWKGAAATGALALPFGMQAMGQWDKVPEEFTRRGGQFDFDYDQMRQEIAEAVSAGDYENFKAVLAKYGATEGTQVGFWDTLAHGAEGGRVRAQEGGLMDLGGMEKDYRQDGGFVPIGGKEKADDVPARLSKNEFVFTADAVRAAGGGDIDQGAEIMENVMKNLEGGGKISEESQGQGARDMFQVSERLSEVV